MQQEWVAEWKGRFASSLCSSSADTTERDFFGFPSQPPFYIGVGPDGMKSVAKGIVNTLQQEQGARFQVFPQTRVEKLEYDESTRQWRLLGTSGMRAFHDTPESIVESSKAQNGIDRLPISNSSTTYDAVVLTDVSCCFENWHRASAGVPLDFAKRVQQKLGARVPLFTVLLTLERVNKENEDQSKEIVPLDGISFPDHDILWFASKTKVKAEERTGGSTTCTTLSSKPCRECWTLVSTPQYAVKKIAETPMQTPSGDFIPQTPQYLHSVPIPALENAFCSQIESSSGVLGELALNPNNYKVVHRDAQRWGSALPCHSAGTLDGEASSTRQVIMGVPYDIERKALAPTQHRDKNSKEPSFVFDGKRNLIQCGDMMSSYTPGFEGAALSGMEAAETLLSIFMQTTKS